MRNTIQTLVGRTGLVATAVLVVTAALTVPFLALAPDESASTEPGGAVFEARDLVDERFVSSVHPIGFIAEHPSGDLLRVEPLIELFDAEQAVRSDPEVGPTLFSYYDLDAGIEVTGPLSIADLIDAELRASGSGGLRDATDAQVKAAAAVLIERHGVAGDVLGLSQQTSRAASGDWLAPAVFLRVVADDTVLGFGSISVNLGGDTEVEEYDRRVQELLRSADGWQIYGLAIDVNLTSQEQGAVAGPFIGFTVLAALLLVGVTFRSYWAMAVVSVMFLILLVWLKGITHLIGFRDDLVLSLIVPIAMVSFGVDYAFHSIGRYREERAAGRHARDAAAAAAVAVSGALVLATVSDAVAFLSNTTAGIESVVQFGVGAAIALLGAYVLLGLVTPLVVAHIEATVPPPTPGRRSTITRIAAALGAAVMAVASVLLLVFLHPAAGVALAIATAMITVAIPARLRAQRADGRLLGETPAGVEGSTVGRAIGSIVAGLTRARFAVLPIAVAVTAVAAVYAVEVPTRFDVEDFFSTDTDFVVSLELIDTHIGDRNGEPAAVYVEGDLTDPANLAMVRARLDEIEAIDSPAFGRTGDDLNVETGVFEVFDAAARSGVMASIVEQQTGVELTDRDGNGLPDTRSQVQALLDVAAGTGVPLDAERVAMTPDDVGTAIDLGGGRGDATVFYLQIVDSRRQSSVEAAREALTPIAAAISDDLGGSFVQVTGSAFVREESLAGTSRALAISLPIAVVACLVVATVFLRSIRFGLAGIVPILMVVAWLYAFMYFAGYAINLVTATIAAVSIGIGIDFALHYICRYREELDRWHDPQVAVRVAGEGTGLALVASAASSAVGFGILALAPMPLFASYGLLTALMIVMALAATLVVLPSLLVVITPLAGIGSGPPHGNSPALRTASGNTHAMTTTTSAHLSMRPPIQAEIEPLHALMAAIERADDIPIAVSVDEVAEMFESVDDDPHDDMRVLVAPDGRTLIGWASVSHSPSGARLERAFLFGGVHPDHRRAGHGRRLLDWQTQRATERLLATNPDLEALAMSQHYGWQHGVSALFARAGYEPVRWFDELHRSIVDLSDVGEPRDLPGIRIVPWTAEHHEAARLVNNAAFADHWGSTARNPASWTEIVNSFGTRLDLSFVAFDGDELVAYSLNAVYPDDEAITGRRDGWIESVATVRSHRGRGIASALIVHSLHAFRRAGLVGSMLGVDADNPTGAYAIYERLGYRPMHRLVRVARTIRPGP